MTILPGFLAGLSVGVYCLGICLPIFVPLILSDNQNRRSSFRLILEFSLGRLLGYLFFGVLIGYLGVEVESILVHRIITVATFSTGLTLIVFSLGFLRLGHGACRLFFGKAKVPVVLGFLTGVNVCPPFLASLAYIFTLKNVFASVLFFFFFFLGTSVYIVPLGLLGSFSRETILQKIARVSGVFVGAYFVYAAFRALGF